MYQENTPHLPDVSELPGADIVHIGFSSSFGQAGSAAFPFLTGAIASKAGVVVLQPMMVGLLIGMFIFWALIPGVWRPAE